MTESEIAKTLEQAGFVQQPKRGIAIDAGRRPIRYARDGIRGSFYATDDYLSATGPYAKLREQVPSSRQDHKGYPVWQGDQLAEVLKEVLASYAAVDRPTVLATETEPETPTIAEAKSGTVITATAATGAAAKVGSQPETTSETPAVTDTAATVEPSTTAPAGTESVAGAASETGTETNVAPEVLAASEAEPKIEYETATTADVKAEAATALQANGKTGNATEPVTETNQTDFGWPFSLYMSFCASSALGLAAPNPRIEVTKSMHNLSEKVSFIWGVADLLRGDYKQSEHGRVILPFILLRRLDQVLALTREEVLASDDTARNLPVALREKMLMKAAGVGFYNSSRLDFPKLLQDPDNVAANLVGFLHGFSANVRDIMERFRFESQITRLDNANLLFLVHMLSKMKAPRCERRAGRQPIGHRLQRLTDVHRRRRFRREQHPSLDHRE